MQGDRSQEFLELKQEIDRLRRELKQRTSRQLSRIRVDETQPTDGQGLAWSDAEKRWEPGTIAVSTHALLDGGTSHTNTTTDTVTRGSIIYGNATPEWDELVLGGANTVLRSDGTDAAWGSVAAGDIAGLPDHDHTGDAGDGGQISHDTALTAGSVSSDDHHTQSHDHSDGNDGSTLNPLILDLPTTASLSGLTTEARVYWDTDDDIMGVGTGSDYRIILSSSSTNVINFGAAANFEIPNGTGPTVNIAGQIALDTDGDAGSVTQGIIHAYDGTRTMKYFGVNGFPSSDNDVMAYDSATNAVTWQAQAGGGGAQDVNLLDGSEHNDTTASAVTRGDLIYGNATPAWDDLALGNAGEVVGSDGTDVAYRPLYHQYVWYIAGDLSAGTTVGAIHRSGPETETITRITAMLGTAAGTGGALTFSINESTTEYHTGTLSELEQVAMGTGSTANSTSFTDSSIAATKAITLDIDTVTAGTATPADLRVIMTTKEAS